MNINSVDLTNRPQRYVKIDTASGQSAPEFKGQKKKTEAKIRIAAAASSFAGMATVLALITKRQGFSFNPKMLKKVPFKDWAVFKIAKRGQKNQKLLTIEEREIIELASGSVAGGLLGGAVFDRKNMKAKGREALSQIAGNVLIPVAFVGGVSRLYKKFETPIKSFMPSLQTGGKKYLRTLNKFSKNIPAIGMTLASLAAGIITGNKVTNYINEKVLGQKQERRIKSSDFAPHVDDLCLAITLMGAKNSPAASAVARAVPLFLSIPGYQVGKARD